MSLTKTYNFTNEEDFTFSDSVLLEIATGLGRLKSQMPPDATFHAGYKLTIDGIAGNGALAGTASGGAAIASQWLDLAHDDNRYVDYDADLNADSQQTGCIEFKCKPNYSGSPSSNKCIFAISKANNDVKNLITLFHFSTGQCIFQTADEDGNLLINEVLGIWSPVADTPYDVSINYDYTTGATRVFIDGTQYGSTITTTLTRSADIGLLRIGATYLGSYDSNFSIRDLIIYNAVQHTSNYTPETFVLYSASDPYMIPDDSIGIDSVSNIVETVTKSGNDDISRVCILGGSPYYHDGFDWVTSDYSYAQSNSVSEIIAAAADLDDIIGDGTTFAMAYVFHSDTGDSTPYIDSDVITYDFFGGVEDAPNECIVYGTARDEDGVIEDAIIKAIPSQPIGLYNNNQLALESKSTLSRANGYWELSLIETTNMDIHWIFYFSYGDNNKEYPRIVPDEETKEFEDLVAPS